MSKLYRKLPCNECPFRLNAKLFSGIEFPDRKILIENSNHPQSYHFCHITEKKALKMMNPDIIKLCQGYELLKSKTKI